METGIRGDWGTYEGILGASPLGLALGDDAPEFDFNGPVPDWIRDHAKDGTFCDIGGIGDHAQNERITAAAHAGATAAAMVDHRRKGVGEWDSFESKMRAHRITGYRTIYGADPGDSSFPLKVGSYDFVHCTGILYLAHAPMLKLQNLARCTRRWLVINTLVVPAAISNSAGRLAFPGSQAVFVPGLSEHERAVLDAHFRGTRGWSGTAFSASRPTFSEGSTHVPSGQSRDEYEGQFVPAGATPACSRRWWLFTRQAFRAAVDLLAFRVVDETQLEGHSLTLLCERVH